MFPDYKIIYMYCLSMWFKTNCVVELEYLDFKNFKYWFHNNEDDDVSKTEIINYIINYK